MQSRAFCLNSKADDRACLSFVYKGIQGTSGFLKIIDKRIMDVNHYLVQQKTVSSFRTIWNKVHCQLFCVWLVGICWRIQILFLCCPGNTNSTNFVVDNLGIWAIDLETIIFHNVCWLSSCISFHNTFRFQMWHLPVQTIRWEMSKS